MIIRIQNINDKISIKQWLRIRRRIIKLDTYHDRIISADVVLKKDSGNNTKGHHCEIRLAIKGNDQFGRSKAPDFEKAASVVIESLRRRLLKLKTIKKIQRRK